MEVLRVENVCKTYGEGYGQVNALRDVSITVDRGEFVAIMGPSGSGKSTLMHIIGGVERPTSGKVFIDGIDIYEMERTKRAIFRRRNIGIVYQFDSLISVLNIEENLSIPMKLDNRVDIKSRIKSMLESIGLWDKRKSYPSHLSGGQKQRVAIARALINAPAVVLADEPTGNLDSKNTQEIIELFKKSNRKYNQTVIMITHDEDIALQADRIIYIDDGIVTKNEKIREI